MALNFSQTILPSSNTHGSRCLKFSQINQELNRSSSARISMADGSARNVSEQTSGCVRLCRFYGKTNWCNVSCNFECVVNCYHHYCVCYHQISSGKFLVAHNWVNTNVWGPHSYFMTPKHPTYCWSCGPGWSVCTIGSGWMGTACYSGCNTNGVVCSSSRVCNKRYYICDCYQGIIFNFCWYTKGGHLCYNPPGCNRHIPTSITGLSCCMYYGGNQYLIGTTPTAHWVHGNGHCAVQAASRIYGLFCSYAYNYSAWNPYTPAYNWTGAFFTCCKFCRGYNMSCCYSCCFTNRRYT